MTVTVKSVKQGAGRKGRREAGKKAAISQRWLNLVCPEVNLEQRHHAVIGFPRNGGLENEAFWGYLYS